MDKVSARLAAFSDSEIGLAFRDELEALAPFLQRLDAPEDNALRHDDSGDLAGTLSKVLALRSLKWKHGFGVAPSLPR